MSRGGAGAMSRAVSRGGAGAMSRAVRPMSRHPQAEP
jgi:hypothetical protein